MCVFNHNYCLKKSFDMLHFKSKNKLDWKKLSFKDDTFRINYCIIFIYFFFLLFLCFLHQAKYVFFYQLTKAIDIKLTNLILFQSF